MLKVFGGNDINIPTLKEIKVYILTADYIESVIKSGIKEDKFMIDNNISKSYLTKIKEKYKNWNSRIE